MKNSFFKILIVLNLLITVSVNTAFSQGLKDQDVKKITYTKKEEHTLLKKIEEMNDYDKKLDYSYLTQREKLIRLEMMKEKYPIDWYDKMFGGFDLEGCNAGNVMLDEQCIHAKALHKMSEEQIISIFLHYDDGYMKFGSNEEMASIITTVLFIRHIGNYLSSFPYHKYSNNKLTNHELNELIENNLILIKYRKYQIKLLIEKLNKF